MRHLVRWTVLLLALPVVVGAQGLAGSWQGTLMDGSRPYRMLFHVRSDSGQLRAQLWTIDELVAFDHSFPADTVRLDGSTLTATWTSSRWRYTGVIGANGNSITGTWTSATRSRPLDLARATEATEWRDPSPHSQRFIRVGSRVTLETLDWGGSGRPVVLLAGNGNTAHIFDKLAPLLTADYHVYGITRRGFGYSTRTTEGFLADSLAHDVLTVIDSLGIRQPVLIGHSLAGQELSSIGSRFPDRVAGLVYLDAGQGQAFYDSSQTRVGLAMFDVQRKLARLSDPGIGLTLAERDTVVRELLEISLPLMQRDLRVYQAVIAAAPDKSVIAPAPQTNPLQRAITLGMQKYTSIHGPVLAIFAIPREAPEAVSRDSVLRARFDSQNVAALSPQVNAFERGVPQARVVRLPHANHYVFRSHEADVLREIRSFIAGLPAGSVASETEPEACRRGGTAIGYVVDGRTATCRAAMAIDPKRIASVDVLKGAAALRFGASGTSSVVVIETKR